MGFLHCDFVVCVFMIQNTKLSFGVPFRTQSAPFQTKRELPQLACTSKRLPHRVTLPFFHQQNTFAPLPYGIRIPPRHIFLLPSLIMPPFGPPFFFPFEEYKRIPWMRCTSPQSKSPHFFLMSQAPVLFFLPQFPASF